MYQAAISHMNESEVKTLAGISIRLEEDEKQMVLEYAKENDLSMSQVVRRALKEFFKDKE